MGRMGGSRSLARSRAHHPDGHERRVERAKILRVVGAEEQHADRGDEEVDERDEEEEVDHVRHREQDRVHDRAQRRERLQQADDLARVESRSDRVGQRPAQRERDAAL